MVKLVQVRIILYIKPVISLKAYQQKPVSKRLSASVPELIYAIQLAARYVPGATYLVKALAAKSLLSTHGHKADLRIGVSKASGFRAHSWLEHARALFIGETALCKLTV